MGTATITLRPQYTSSYFFSGIDDKRYFTPIGDGSAVATVGMEPIELQYELLEEEDRDLFSMMATANTTTAKKTLDQQREEAKPCTKARRRRTAAAAAATTTRRRAYCSLPTSKSERTRSFWVIIPGANRGSR